MKAFRARFAVSTGLLVLVASSVAAQVPPDAGVRVDSIFEQWSSVDSPGCAVGVAVNGLTVLSRAYGMADLEHNIPNTPDAIFEPLGMRNTQWRDDYTRIVRGRSTAYEVDDDGVFIQRPIENVHGNGGLLTTVGDLIIWAETLEHGTLGGPEFKRMMHEQGRLNDDRQITYVAGLL